MRLLLGRKIQPFIFSVVHQEAKRQAMRQGVSKYVDPSVLRPLKVENQHPLPLPPTRPEGLTLKNPRTQKVQSNKEPMDLEVPNFDDESDIEVIYKELASDQRSRRIRRSRRVSVYLPLSPSLGIKLEKSPLQQPASTMLVEQQDDEAEE